MTDKQTTNASILELLMLRNTGLKDGNKKQANECKSALLRKGIYLHDVWSKPSHERMTAAFPTGLGLHEDVAVDTKRVEVWVTNLSYPHEDFSLTVAYDSKGDLIHFNKRVGY